MYSRIYSGRLPVLIYRQVANTHPITVIVIMATYQTPIQAQALPIFFPITPPLHLETVWCLLSDIHRIQWLKQHVVQHGNGTRSTNLKKRRIEFESNRIQNLLPLVKKFALCRVRARSFAPSSHSFGQNRPNECVGGEISRARTRHIAEFFGTCRVCVLLRTPINSKFWFFRRNYWMCRVCVHAKVWP